MSIRHESRPPEENKWPERPIRSQDALASLQIDLRFDVEILGHRCGPKIAADFERNEIRTCLMDVPHGFDRERIRNDSRLKHFDGLSDFVLNRRHLQAGR